MAKTCTHKLYTEQNAHTLYMILNWYLNGICQSKVWGTLSSIVLDWRRMFSVAALLL